MGTGTEQPTLRILTFSELEPDTVPVPGSQSCPHDYTGWCDTCVAERQRLVARGVRPRRPVTTRKAA